MIAGRRWAFAILAAMSFLAGGARAYAIDFYEIQIYPTETTDQDHLQVELHSNSVTTATGELAKQELNPYQIHETIETTFGLTPHLEIGQYFATAKLGDHYEYAGSRTKCHFGIAATDYWPVRLGGNVEFDYMRFAAEDQPLTLELRPIAESRIGKFMIIGNFAFEKPFRGSGTHRGVTLAPSGSLSYDLADWITPALEYYGDMGPVQVFPGVQRQQHFIVPAVNLHLIANLELNFGIGVGVTRASNGLFIKSIVGWTF